MLLDRLPRYNERYPAPYLSVDLAIMTAADGVVKVLVEERDDLSPDLSLGLPHVLAFEDIELEEIARRHIRDRLFLCDMPLEVVHVGSRPERDPRGRVISVTSLALAEAGLLTEMIEAHGRLHLLEVQFYPQTGLCSVYQDGCAVDLALDHEVAVAAALRVMRERLDGSLLPFQLLPEAFTLLELQGVHEAILGHSIDKVTFRKRALHRLYCDELRLVKTGLVQAGPHRPASLYRLA